MEKLYVLGTGMATVTKCYNTCFTIFNGEEHFLVDTGGGNGILAILEKKNIDLKTIHNIFLSHRHTDHLLGIFWMMRVIGRSITEGNYEGDLNIYCHSDLVDTILTIFSLIGQERYNKLIGNRIKIYPVEDKQEVRILNYDVTFLDIHAKDGIQFGFKLELENGKQLSFLGDEPYREQLFNQVKDSDWLLHEAFCLDSQKERFKPYEKGHCTVKDACENAAKLSVKNLVLWHTEDTDLENRQKLYIEEGREYFKGNIFVPNDLDVIELD